MAKRKEEQAPAGTSDEKAAAEQAAAEKAAAEKAAAEKAAAEKAAAEKAAAEKAAAEAAAAVAAMVTVRVIKQPIYEDGAHYFKGDTFMTTAERAAGLCALVEVVTE